MNAPATLTSTEALDRYESRWGAARPAFDLSAAHMKAHGWVDIARPLIKAYLALDLVQSDVLVASHNTESHAYDISAGASDIGSAVSALYKRIESVRDDVLADLSPPAPNWGRNLGECSPEVIDYDDLCDMWAERIRDVASVDSAIDREARRDD